MSIQYFYNFCLKELDKTDLSGDLLTVVRKSYFRGNGRIKDKITGNSDAQPYYYDFCIEKEKPMKWLVKDATGTTLQEVMLSDGGKYYIYFYENRALYKRLLFSKYHTLLKGEYFDTETGAVKHTLEPRKAQNSLCILYTMKSSPVQVPLFEEPEVYDEVIRERIQNEFEDYTVIAATNEGLVRFLSDDQLKLFNSFKEKCEQEQANIREESFVGDDTPLLDKINAKDFNVKRNLSAALDITRAMEFGVRDDFTEVAEAERLTKLVNGEDVTPPEEVINEETAIAEAAAEQIMKAIAQVQSAEEEQQQTEEPQSVEPQSVEPQSVEAQTEESQTNEPQTEEVQTEEIQPAEEQSDEPKSEASAEPAPEPVSEDAVEPEPEPASEEATNPELAPENEPDKRIIADGAVYSYYGDLDEQGNRSGYGRTLTELGRTAYEGYYFNDKRSGNGSYYYKDGTLCYTGDWLENARHGIGVGVSSRDGSIHVGKWKNNKPDGNGVRLDADGDIRFVCKELSDGTTVLMNYMPDDTVVISKYDESGMKTGESTVSLKDLQV